MKKLYRKGTVHPSPPLISDQLAFLPATILTLAASLSPEDREVLAYLISCSSFTNFSGNRRNTQKTTTTGGGGGDHPTSFSCNCFRCYMSYWVRWDSSPNRQTIHEIIDAFEDGLAQSKKDKNRKERRKRGSKGSDELKRSELGSSKDELGESESVEEITIGGGGGGGGEGEDCGGSDGDGDGDGDGDDDEEEEGFEKGSVRKFVSFVGEKFWSVWT